ncbi:hypothetical protein OMP38_30495 [Cohnella ginsengisoli]|uniref:Uncharacterized protein n=1 Tax=Cohnella ginsengisoli TaxID=425004 RepID=A0A9X4KLW2_9BACL|nr:hypothetical protein [Cohnella ginsengisoli]MDG0794684.1 hypothetical protein [Cohnella ginsengisoli]
MKNPKTAAVLLVSQLIFVLLVVPWLIVALTSFMIFDSPDSVTAAWPIAIIVFVWAYPIALIVSIAVSWVLYHKRKFKGALWWGFVPVIWVLVAVYVTFFLDAF